MRQFYQTYPKSHALSDKLTWTHYRLLLKIERQEARDFYQIESAKLDEIRRHNHILTPGRYVGMEEEEDDGIPFDEKMRKLTSELSEQMKEGQSLNEEIKNNLAGVGFKIWIKGN